MGQSSTQEEHLLFKQGLSPFNTKDFKKASAVMQEAIFYS